MKIGETLVIMSLQGTLSHSAKLLKVPRIYNALISSDENVQPSQSYPALAPVIQSIQYPLPGFVSTGVYQTAGSLNQGSFVYSVKEDFYNYNFVKMAQPVFKINLPKLPEEKSPFEPQPQLFRPVVPVVPVGLNSTSGTGLPQLQDRNIYYESSPVQPGDKTQFPKTGIERPGVGRYGLPDNKSPIRYGEAEELWSNDTSKNYNVPINDESNLVEPDYQKTDPQAGNLPALDDLVKNNRSKDPSIVDIPPPPLPVGSKSDTRKEEYPPPPIGFL